TEPLPCLVDACIRESVMECSDVRPESRQLLLNIQSVCHDRDLLGNALLVYRNSSNQLCDVCPEPIPLLEQPFRCSCLYPVQCTRGDTQPLLKECGQPLSLSRTHAGEGVCRSINDGEHRSRIVRRHELLLRCSEHIGQTKQHAQIQRRVQTKAGGKIAKLRYVRGQPRFVELQLVTGRFAIDLDAQGNVPPGNPAAQSVAHLTFPTLEGRGHLEARIEETMVDRANLRGHPGVSNYAVGCAEPRHAPDHGQASKYRRGNAFVNSGSSSGPRREWWDAASGTRERFHNPRRMHCGTGA